MTAIIWAAILAWLKELRPSAVETLKLLATARIGADLQQGADAEDELEKLDVAARAASRVDIMSDGDVERELRKRGLYKDAPESGGGTLH